MVTIIDVAKYITTNLGEMSAMKLQKLAYYSQAWHLVWDDEPLFNEDFQAWANGPVAPALYDLHRGAFKVDKSFFSSGKVKRISAESRVSIDKILDFYGDKSAHWLSNLTHQEDPWKNARSDLQPGEPSSKVITTAAMVEYYSAL